MAKVPAWLKYANFNAVRNDPLSPELIAMFEQFMPELGLGMEVFSGGQEAEGPDRVGSHRHDLGGSGDFFFTKGGRRLSYDNPEDLPLIKQAITRARRAGVTGWGAGAGYMQPGSIHGGLGPAATWGAGGKSENAPEWLKQAVADGTADAQMAAAGYTPEQRRNAIASIESAGSGDYGAVGNWTNESMADRDRAYGRYQIMGNNVAPWAKQYLGMDNVTPEMLLADPALQDKLFDAVYSDDYVKKYGERGAASKWYTGSEKEPIVTDVNGKLTGQSYADKYMAALGNAGGAATGGMVTGATSPSPGYSPPGEDAVEKQPFKPEKSGWEAFGGKFAEMLGKGSMGSGGSGFPGMQSPETPGAALAPTASGGIDPEANEIQRQKLAMAMQRLNSGKLWV